MLLFMPEGINAVQANKFFPKQSWQYLGSKNIGYAHDKDVLYLHFSNQRYTTIELLTEKPYCTYCKN